MSTSPRSQDFLALARTRLPEPLYTLVAAVSAFERLTEQWHLQPEPPDVPAVSLADHLQALHACNFRLWHTEDEARRTDVPDAHIARCKRRIDRLNQQRHAHIERVDEAVFGYLYEQHDRGRSEAALHSETPGSVLDRLSILALKVYHMGCEARRQDATASHRQRCQQRLAMLQEQRDDLAGCLLHLCVDLWEGRTRFKVYRQFKMYNDPELNPALYRHRRGQNPPTSIS